MVRIRGNGRLENTLFLDKMMRKLSISMGKESEVLQAAQEGNLSKLESLFTQKRFGGLLKGPNINGRDSSGCTALHLAALYGNSDACVFLLHNDASANVPDNAGSFPLHLAAFNGHYEIAQTLISRGPSRAQVNEANMAGDTALHVASQYGHEKVVKVLLGNYADASFRNSKDESPLDLAAQYGRLLTVELFLNYDRTLCYKSPVHRHSPLHLAARNGHADVVRALLNYGMPVNATCDMGTALHCAATYGKTAVAKLLIERGIDIEIEDDNGQKVLDILVKNPSQTSQEITGLIYAKPASSSDAELSRSPATSYSGQQFEIVEHPKRKDMDNQEIISQPSGYDVVPPPRPKPGKPKNDDNRPYSLIAATSLDNASDDENNLTRVQSTPIELSSKMKKDMFFSKYDGDDKKKSGPYCLVGEDVPNLKTKKSVKQKRTSASVSRMTSLQPQEEEVGATYSEIPEPGKRDSYYTQMNSADNVYQVPPNADFHHNQSPGNDDLYQVPPNRNDDLYQVPPTTNFPKRGTHLSDIPQPSTITPQDQMNIQEDYYGVPSSLRKVDSKAINVPKPKQRSQTMPSEITSSPMENYDNVNLQHRPMSSSTECYDNVQITNSPMSGGENYDNVNIKNKENVQSDSYYQRPPTGSFNSAGSTEGLFYQGSPNSPQSYYQRPPSLSSTPGDDQYYQAPPSNFKPKPLGGIKQSPSQPQQYTSVKTKSMKQKRTATIVKRDIDLSDSPPEQKEILSDSPVPKLEESKQLTKEEIEAIERERKIQEAKENLLAQANIDEPEGSPKPVPKPRMKQSRTSERRVESGYRMSETAAKQPLDETYEWSKIDAFLSNLEEYAGDAKDLEAKPMSTKSVPEWLDSIGMAIYEPMFLANGYDEIEFINGCLDDQDLIELGILDSGHRKKIMDSTAQLPQVKVIGENDNPIPDKIDSWLDSLKLNGYNNRFVINGYGSMDRVRVIWELELVTVLDISAIGHRKRMLNSLGRRPPQIKAPVSWVKRFADADAGRVKKNVPDDSMDVAKELMNTAKDLTISRDPKKSTSSDTTQENTPNSPTKSVTSTPSETTADSTDGSRTTTYDDRKHKKDGWLHTPDVLMYESVAYSAQYLGSHPVQKVKGVESTLDACSRMKVLSQNVHKMPSIVLSISIRGIDYIDSNSKMIINQYSINNISFIAQDPDDLNVFAYITRDEMTRKNYCHVFKAKSTRQADEIVLTLGQCFEVAYEQHMALMEIKKSQQNATTPLSSQSSSREPPPVPKPYAERNSNKENMI
ncbi:ankyrin repeat and sterile alpha motif domain-containing protein 1B-like isoform X2 [Clytia hemisphaerica]|uniref:Uncharacterized protein n=1 Tax=Clytia hemisphaerica TaxID=252671 RepID=A0A7M5WYD7_9CNID